MAGLERGIGAFLSGVAGGVNGAAQRRRQDEQTEYQRKRDAELMEMKRLEMQRGIQREDEMRPYELERARLQNENARRTGEAQQFDLDTAREKKKEADDAKASAGKSILDARKSYDEGIEKSIIPVEAQGPMPGGQAMPETGKYKVKDDREGGQFGSVAEARKYAQEQAPKFLDFYFDKFASQHVENLISQGKAGEAKAFYDWTKDENVQTGMRHWSQAYTQARVGDYEGAADSMLEAYNTKGYMNNGSWSASAKPQKDKDGKLTGFEVSFSNADTGEKRSQVFENNEDLVYGFIDLMSPQNAYKEASASVDQANKIRADTVKEQRSEEQFRRREAYKAELKQGLADGNEALQKRLDSAIRTIAATPQGMEMSPEQLAKAGIDLIAAQAAELEGYTSKQGASGQASAPQPGAAQNQGAAPGKPKIWMP